MENQASGALAHSTELSSMNRAQIAFRLEDEMSLLNMLW